MKPLSMPMQLTMTWQLTIQSLTTGQMAIGQKNLGKQQANLKRLG